MRKMKIEPSEKLPVRLQYDFAAKDLPRSCSLVMEQADRATVRVNGNTVSTDTEQWHWDRQFRRLDIAAHLMAGSNLIEVSFDGRTDTNIEDAYLVGDFGVSRNKAGRYQLSAEPHELRSGDWGPQGYPFYAGSMIYEQTIYFRAAPHKRILLRLCEPKGTLFRITINGKTAGELCWHPWEIDITPFARPGDNQISIEVISSLRNTFGPLHNVLGERITWTGPEDFEDEKHWTDDYIFAPYGLINGGEIVIV
jgi:hypothetical protein